MANVSPELKALADAVCPGVAEDGIVEAVVHETLPVLGVQYHPERQSFCLRRDDATDAATLFRWWAAQAE